MGKDLTTKIKTIGSAILLTGFLGILGLTSYGLSMLPKKEILKKNYEHSLRKERINPKTVLRNKWVFDLDGDNIRDWIIYTPNLENPQEPIRRFVKGYEIK